jgi:hypothetical protein
MLMRINFTPCSGPTWGYAQAMKQSRNNMKPRGMMERDEVPLRLASPKSGRRTARPANAMSLNGHGLTVTERHPAADDAVCHPDSCAHYQNIPKRNTDYSCEKHGCDYQPKQRVPERSYLPAEMRIEVGAAYLITFYVVNDYSDDGGPAGEKRSNDERWSQYAH